jgi:hypothetical protein
MKAVYEEARNQLTKTAREEILKAHGLHDVEVSKLLNNFDDAFTDLSISAVCVGISLLRPICLLSIRQVSYRRSWRVGKAPMDPAPGAPEEKAPGGDSEPKVCTRFDETSIF